MAIASGFERRWNFPNCLGALDGKHINIAPPQNCGSYYYNYKGMHSIVLLAVADANYEVIYADVGSNGRVSDGGVWRDCSLNRAIISGAITLPPERNLPNSNICAPFVFVCDDAFPLKTTMMKPYPFRSQTKEQRIFSYRLSRARRIVENTFGIIANKFRVLRTTICLEPSKVQTIVMATLVLHNLLRREHSSDHTPSGSFDVEDLENHQIIQGTWRREGELTGLQPVRLGRLPADGKAVRELFCEYFNSSGAVPWQENMISAGNNVAVV